MDYTCTQCIRNTLKLLSIPANLKGYTYLVEAISIAIDNPNIIYAMTKELYPGIAKSFGATAPRVERAIRHAISHCFDDAPTSVIESIFSNSINPDTGRATNTQFIATVAEYIKDKTKNIL